MKKKDSHLIFLKVTIPLFLIVISICYILKVDPDVIGNICAVFIIILFGAFIINFSQLEPQKDFEQTRTNLEKNGDNNERIEYAVMNILNDSKLKKWYMIRKIFSPIILIPFSVLVGIVVRIFIETQLKDIYGYYQIQNIETYITIALIFLCVYSIVTYLRKTFQIQAYLGKIIFGYTKSAYQMKEISSDDEIVKSTMDAYINMIQRKFKYQVNTTFKFNSSEKRFFKLWLYQRGRPTTNAGAGAETIFDGVSVIIPTDSKSLNLFYKTDDYIGNRLAYDSFNNAIPTNTITGELKEEIDKIHSKYNKPFKIATVDGNVQIFCEQELVPFGSISKLQVYVADYYKAIECVLELSEIIENYI